MTDWSDVIRRVRDGEPVRDVMDEFLESERQRFRRYLLSMGPRGLDALIDYDARCRALDSGVDGACGAWAALSRAQRKVMWWLGDGRVLVQRASQQTVYDAIGGAGGPDRIDGAAGVRTVRALAARELVAWDGGAFNPEARAVLTERGRFVLAHGGEGAGMGGDGYRKGERK